MIEREFIAQKTREYYIQKFVEKSLGNVGISSIKLKKIPLGERIVINTSRPSLIVGSRGSNIRALTKTLKKEFNLENPQIEINEVKEIFLDANIVAEKIVASLERFGSARFKGVGHKMMENVMNAGAMGVEIIISGKIPGARAKSWRFYTGYLKKCGDVAISDVRIAKKAALLKSGIIGVKVSIMPPGLVLPDSVELLSEPKVEEESGSMEKKESGKKSGAEEKRGKKKESAQKGAAKKKPAKGRKKAAKKEVSAKKTEEKTEKASEAVVSKPDESAENTEESSGSDAEEKAGPSENSPESMSESPDSVSEPLEPDSEKEA
ncbi:MAG: 30S ribosomal protein S3 [Nanoarchaeota archaeon]